MDEKNVERLDSLIQEAEEGLTEADEETKPQLEEKLQGLKSLKEDFNKRGEISENQRIRAEKAEDELKELKKPGVKPDEKVVPPNKDLSQTDLIVLIKADVTEEEDIQEVVDFAKLKGISVAEALKSSVIRTVLSEKKEERQTAEATATGNKRGGTTAPSAKELLQRAQSKGELPEKDEDMRKLIEAQIAEKAGK